MADERRPEEMPGDWRVRSFAAEKGFGTLAHASGEEVVFQIEAWNLGGWEPPQEEAAVLGAASPLLPKEGEPVRVAWRRSASGNNVPSLVQPTGRVSVKRERYTLKAWLKAVQNHTGRFAGVTAAEILRVLATIDQGLAERWTDGTHDASEFAYLLMHLGHLREDPAWASAHTTWIYCDDHRWDRKGAAGTLPVMLGLPPDSVATAGDGTTTGRDESISQYVQKVNAAAASQGATVLLHEVDLDGDEHVFVCMKQDAFEALVAGGYVRRAESDLG